MKKILLFSLLLMSGTHVAQEPRTLSAISRMPYEANSYLILNSNKNPSVVSWVVTISKKEFNPTINKWNFIPYKRLNLVGTDFMMIDQIYNTSDYFIKVEGKDAARSIIVTEGPLAVKPDVNSSTLGCWWACLGKTYGYQINNWLNYQHEYDAINPSTGLLEHYSVTVPGGLELTTLNKSNGTPYYEWISHSTYTLLGNLIGLQKSEKCKYYDLNNSPTYPISMENNIPGAIIKLEGILPTDGYKDATNNNLSGTIYGIQKRFGPWNGQSAFGGIKALNYDGESRCSDPFDWARNVLNGNSANNANNVPDLTCDGSTFGSNWSGWGIGNNEPVSGVIDWAEPCIIHEIIQQTSTNGNIKWIFKYEGDCNLSGGGNVEWTWPTSAKIITFQKNGGNSNPISYTYSSFFDANGQFIGRPIIWEKGLYSMTIQFVDNTYGVYYIESKENQVSTFKESDFLGVNIFPVPVVGNSFNISYNSTAKTNFTYELYDKNGVLLYTERYVMEKDKSYTDLINVPQGIPSGLLVNKIKFSDGSEISIQTIK